jgi:hypothetical protein
MPSIPSVIIGRSAGDPPCLEAKVLFVTVISPLLRRVSAILPRLS